MTDVKIRTASEADAAAIARLNTEELGYPVTVSETVERLAILLKDPAHRIIIAQADGMVVGYLHVADYCLLYHAPLKNILGIAVLSDYRRCGIGRLLMEAAEDWAINTGASGIRLVSGEQRKEAHEFYLHCGYDGNKKQRNFKKMLPDKPLDK